MKKKIFIFLSILIFPFFINAENLKLENENIIDWNNTYDLTNFIFQTEDDGYIVICTSNATNIEGIENKGETDVIILKYDKDWNLIWVKNWGGNGADYFYSVIQTKDGGFLASAQSSSTDIEGITNKGDVDAFIVKFDKDWDIEWQSSWGGDRKDYFSYGFEAYEDDGYVMFGRTQSKNLDNISKYDTYYDAIIVKYDKDGNLLWEKKWGGNRHERFTEVIQSENGGYIAVGQTNSFDLEGISETSKYVSVIVEFDKDGNAILAKTWEPNGDNKQSEFMNIVKSKDGNYILTARNDSANLQNITNKGEEDIILVKYDKDWNLLWQKNWGGNFDDISEKIIQTNDGNFVVIAKSLSTDIENITNQGDYDGVIIKFDKDGNILWEQNYGGPGVDNFKYIIQGKDKSLIVLCFHDLSNIEEITDHNDKYSTILKYLVEYDITEIPVENGKTVIEQKDSHGMVNPIPNKGYKLEKIIIKDKEGKILDLEITKQEDGTYSFPVYTDVSVEVIYKEAIENPKTGLFNYIGLLLSMLVCSLISFWFIMRKDERFEL